ncbi:MAG: hypothetical protein ACLQOO_15915 [Terriglobia bacterium]
MEDRRNESPQPEPRDASAVGTPPLQQENPKGPKRKYTAGEKSRASSRENLKKAISPKEWKYRLTERRLAACYPALEKAVDRLRQFDSPHYGLGFKRGTYCASILRSLGAGGREAGGLRGVPAAVSRAVPQGG